MCEIDLGDPCEVWIPKTLVARKAHECAGCGRTIQPGETHQKTFMIFEGEPSTERHCLACERDIQAFGKAHDGMTPHPATLVDVLHECITESMPNEVRRWKAMLARVRARSAPPTQGRAQQAGADGAPLGASGPSGPGPVGR